VPQIPKNKMNTQKQDLTTIKKDREDQISALINSTGMFFAFSTEQFNENKTPLKEGEKYVSIGMGAYIPKGNVDSYISGIEAIGKAYRAAVKNNKLRYKEIAYELNNHEAYYTGDITDTLEALGSDYTHDEVMIVFYKEREKQDCEY
jgi:hypothetical protein